MPSLRLLPSWYNGKHPVVVQLVDTIYIYAYIHPLFPHMLIPICKRSCIRNVEIHRLRYPHDALVAFLVAIPAPCRSGLGRGQGNRVAPGVGDFGPAVWRRRRSSVVVDAINLVEGVGVGVEVTAVCLVNFVEFAVGSASAAGCVGAGFAGAVAVELQGWGTESGEAGTDDAGAAFDFGPDGRVDGAPCVCVC